MLSRRFLRGSLLGSVGTSLPRNSAVVVSFFGAEQEIGEHGHTKTCAKKFHSQVEVRAPNADEVSRAGQNDGSRPPPMMHAAGDPDQPLMYARKGGRIGHMRSNKLSEHGREQENPGERPQSQNLSCQAARIRKQEREILGPALTQLAEAAVHAGAHGVGSVAEADNVSGSFHGAGESYVFENVVSKGGMASDLIVDFTLDQDVL